MYVIPMYAMIGYSMWYTMPCNKCMLHQIVETLKMVGQACNQMCTLQKLRFLNNNILLGIQVWGLIKQFHLQFWLNLEVGA